MILRYLKYKGGLKCQIEMEKDQEKEAVIQADRKVEERKENVKVIKWDIEKNIILEV